MLSLAFLGDVGLTKDVYQTVCQKGPSSIFKDIRDELTGYDLVVANLEGCLSEKWTEHPAKNKLCLPPTVMEIFEEVPVEVFSLCNNHILDDGQRGLETTVTTLERHSYHHFGAGEDLAQAETVLYVERQGKKIAFIGACDDSLAIAGKEKAGAAPMNFASLKERVIEAKKQADILIVVLHADYEFIRYPSPARRRLCRKLAALGVDLILQHHPHVVQPWEYIGDCLVIYSIGNFVFSVVGNDYMEHQEGTRNGVICEVSFPERQKPAVSFKHIWIDEHHRPVRCDTEEARMQEELIQKLSDNLKAGVPWRRAWREFCGRGMIVLIRAQYYHIRRHGVVSCLSYGLRTLKSPMFRDYFRGIVSFGYL